MSTAPRVTFVAADIGGTNSRMLLQSVDAAGGTRVIFERKYPSSEFASFEAVVKRFLNDASVGSSSAPATAQAVPPLPVAACFAVAGPVTAHNDASGKRGGKRQTADITNVSWPLLDSAKLATATGIAAVELINDFAGVGYGLTCLQSSMLPSSSSSPSRVPLSHPNSPHLLLLNPATAAPVNSTGPIACLGAGTGLGQVYCTPGPGGQYAVHASEGGHTDFAPRGGDEAALLEYARAELAIGRVSVERLTAGPVSHSPEVQL
jgi:glucokinase